MELTWIVGCWYDAAVGVPADLSLQIQIQGASSE